MIVSCFLETGGRTAEYGLDTSSLERYNIFVSVTLFNYSSSVTLLDTRNIGKDPQNGAILKREGNKKSKLKRRSAFVTGTLIPNFMSR